MNSMKCLLLGIIASVSTSTAEAAQLYWTEQSTGKIQRSELDGSNVVDLVVGQNAPHSLAYHGPSGKMYWTDGGDDVIRRATLDGSNVETLLATGDPRGIAIDPIAGKMYFSTYVGSQSAEVIQRTNLDGTGIETLWNAPSSPDYAPFNLEIDVANDALYFTEDRIENVFKSDVDFTGGNPTVIVGTAGHPVGLSLDMLAQQLYWVDDDGGNVYRSDADGSNSQIIASGFVKPSGIEVLSESGVMFVSDDGTDTIYQLNLDGTGQTAIVTSVPFAFDLMVVPEPSSSVLAMSAAIGCVVLVRRYRR